MKPTFRDAEQRLSAMIGRDGVHSFGRMADEAGFTVYADIRSDEQATALYRKLAAELAPFKVKLVRADAPVFM